ncbi:splicing factor, arginine/serine-rich 19 isoform X2 [Cucumis melo var. makuwa]|uniref:Splicing factor, arginine/serine-rich 19 isoform X2 n=1 Tax=Cucumis melo var. makuwa TaxID=1194695 RepID=A0A5D3E6W3_CUCMM|nr:splicing factor, arginine/serine-rich 19 isoform X2 [Cucumis melo var. makuwa]
MGSRRKKNRTVGSEDPSSSSPSSSDDSDSSSMRSRRHYRRDSVDTKSDRRKVKIMEPEVIVRQLLKDFPDIGNDLKQLLKMIDDGQAVDISGISVKSLTKRLKKLFLSLNLEESQERVFLLPSSVHPTLEVIGPLIEMHMDQKSNPVDDSITLDDKSSPPLNMETTQAREDNMSELAYPDGEASGPKRRMLGPEMPSAELLAAAAKLTEAQTELREAELEEDDELFVGPPPPAMVAEAETANEAERFEEVSRIMDVEGDSPYDILGLNRNLSIENIKKRYWKMSLLVHPDKCSHPQANQAFIRLNNAFKELQDPDKRKALDDKIKFKEEQEQFKVELRGMREAAKWRKSQGKDEILDTIIDGTQIETNKTAVIAATMVKLLLQLQKQMVIIMGPCLASAAQPSEGNSRTPLNCLPTCCRCCQARIPRAAIQLLRRSVDLLPLVFPATIVPFWSTAHPRENLRLSPSDAQERWRGEDSLIRNFIHSVRTPFVNMHRGNKSMISSLIPKFDIVCGCILGQRPFSSLIEMCYKVRLEEDRTNAMSVLTTPTTDSTAFSARSLTMTVRRTTENKSLSVSIVRNNGTLRNGPSPSSTLGVIVQLGMPQSLSLIGVDGKNPWILDSGAIDHLTGLSENFVSYILCASNEKIRITDGSLALIAGKGQSFPFEGVSFRNVLHVSKFSYNLLSISKITRDLNYKATFLPDFVSFKDSLGEDDWHCLTQRGTLSPW